MLPIPFRSCRRCPTIEIFPCVLFWAPWQLGRSFATPVLFQWLLFLDHTRYMDRNIKQALARWNWRGTAAQHGKSRAGCGLFWPDLWSKVRLVVTQMTEVWLQTTVFFTLLGKIISEICLSSHKNLCVLNCLSGACGRWSWFLCFRRPQDVRNGTAPAV